MDINEIKQIADLYLNKAQGIYIKDGVFYPILISIKDREPSFTSLRIENEKDKLALNSLILEASSKADALIIIMEIFCLDADTCEDIKNHPNKIEALISIIHTPQTSLSHFLFHKNKNFLDNGWSDLDNVEESFKNPYQTSFKKRG